MTLGVWLFYMENNKHVMERISPVMLPLELLVSESVVEDWLTSGNVDTTSSSQVSNGVATPDLHYLKSPLVWQLQTCLSFSCIAQTSPYNF